MNLKISAYVLVSALDKLRFLDPAVRSSLRCGTPQPDLAASVTGSFKEENHYI
ncbi:hypothetical protein WDK74_22230 [Escherichia coli]